MDYHENVGTHITDPEGESLANIGFVSFYLSSEISQNLEDGVAEKYLYSTDCTDTIFA